MLTSPELDQLALRLSATARGEASPPLLFLGHDCARAANVPDLDQVIQQMCDSLRGTADLSRIKTLAEHLALYGEEYKDFKEGQAALETIVSAPDLAKRLHEQFLALPDAERAVVLLQVYDAIPVPLFYQDLTALLWAGCFTEILTTNVDTLLEQALNQGGFRPDFNYQVINLGADVDPDDGWDSGSAAPRFVRIYKLHGDLGQQQVNLTPEEIFSALEPQRAFVKGELSGDIVMVGYAFESEPIDLWLTRTTGQVWWVSAEPPDPARIAPIVASRTVTPITGPEAAPSEFFGFLEAALLQPATGAPQPEPVSFAVPDGSTTSLQRAPSDVQVEDVLRSKISRSQTVLYSLEQQMAPSERDLATRGQIEYQRKQIVELSDQLRGVSPAVDQAITLVREMADAAERAGVDAGTLTFLRGQVATVETEQGHDRPNQDVVSAALGAMLVLAERMGPDVARPDVVQTLRSFFPGTSRWR
jgi:hypothetical protein